MAALYRGADLMLNPSTVDNMPNSVLEALASGVAVVSTDVGGVPYLVEDGKTALLVPPRSPEAMADAMLRLAALARTGVAPEGERPPLCATIRLGWSTAAAARSLSGGHQQQHSKDSKPSMNAQTLPQTGLYTQVVSRLLFPLHERMKRHTTVAVRQQMEQSQWWPEAELQALQLRRLRQLLARAQAHVPYYRELFASIGFDPLRDVQSLADLQRLPLLDKAAIRAAGEGMKADDARRPGALQHGRLERRAADFLHRQGTRQP